MASLSRTTTREAIEAACTLPADAREQLGHLLTEEARLKASDPTKERDHLVSLAADIPRLANTCDELAGALGAEAIVRLAGLRSNAGQLRAAATVASAESFDAEPVSGVGTATWRALWEAARAFPTTEPYRDHEFPVTGDDSRCVLCHQNLSEEASDRLRRFQAFMTDTTERGALTAERALADARAGFQQLAVSDAAATAANLAFDQPLDEAAVTFLVAAATTREALIQWIEATRQEPPGALGQGPGPQMAERATQLRNQAAAIDATTFARRLEAVGRQAAELQANLALAAAKDALADEVARLATRHQIEEAKRTTDTTHITRKASDLTRDHVTRDVRDRFTRESERLRLRRITLDDGGAVKGKLLHRPALLGAARQAAVTKHRPGRGQHRRQVVQDPCRVGALLGPAPAARPAGRSESPI
ncbi:MAG: hypothetical protein AB7N61_24625 [Acidimicrobiia bacterium]